MSKAAHTVWLVDSKGKRTKHVLLVAKIMYDDDVVEIVGGEEFITLYTSAENVQ